MVDRYGVEIMTMVREQHLPLVYRYDHYYSPKVFIRIPIQNERLEACRRDNGLHYDNDDA